MPEFKPIASATTDGCIAVYIGSGYWKLPMDAATRLRQQLGDAINAVRVEQAAGDDHD